MDDHKNLICYAPWIHSYLGPEGQRGLCCEAKPFSSRNKEFADYWNSQELKDIRREMLKGELPKEYCSVCLDADKHSNLPIYTFQVSAEEKEKILSETQEDGSYLGVPTSLDYRGNNTCNLSCRTCSPLYSSKIEAVLEPKKKGENFNDRIVEQKKLITEKTRNLYYANGESFLQKSHWELLGSIYKRQLAGQITLTYNTNLQFPLSLVEKNREVLASFKEIILNVSIDGAGETGEFVRDGLSWKKFKSHVAKIKKDSLFRIDNFDITLTLPFLLDYKELVDFIVEEKIYAEVHMVVEGGFYQKLLSPFLLRPDQLRDQCHEIIEYINTKDSIVLAGLKKVLLAVIDRAPHIERELYTDEVIGEALRFALDVDKKFNRVDLFSFYQKFPLTKDIIERALKKGTEKIKRDLSPDQSYWRQFGETTLLFPGVQVLEEKLGDPTFLKSSPCLIVSDSTFLSRILNSGQQNKFDAQSLIESMVEEGRLKVRKERLGPISFLLRTSKWRGVGQTMDIITTPLRGIIGFHCRYIILPRE